MDLVVVVLTLSLSLSLSLSFSLLPAPPDKPLRAFYTRPRFPSRIIRPRVFLRFAISYYPTPQLLPRSLIPSLFKAFYIRTRAYYSCAILRDFVVDLKFPNVNLISLHLLQCQVIPGSCNNLY
jgi:hypothetical protein